MLTKHFGNGSLLGRSGIGAHGQRNPFSSTYRDLTDHRHHHFALRRGQTAGYSNGGAQLDLLNLPPKGGKMQPARQDVDWIHMFPIGSTQYA